MKPAQYATHLHPSSFLEVPWKNGGGVSRQVAIHPPGADFAKDEFLWRLSSARVESAGPFSLFPDYRRLLTLTAGKELVLRSPEQMVAVRPGTVFAFGGEEAFESELPHGPVTDLGFLFRRSHKATMRVLEFHGRTRSFELQAETNFFFVVSGSFAAATYPGELLFTLEPGSALRVDELPEFDPPDPRIVLLEPEGKGAIVTVEIDSV